MSAASVRRALVACALAGLAGGFALEARAQAPDSVGAALQAWGGGAWERVVSGVAVRDADGRLLEQPFLGGFNLPRPQLADADGDGDLDLFVQERSDRVVFFRNDGGSGADRFRWESDAFEDLSVGEWFRFVDVDLDGDLDLLAEQPYSYIRYYRNDGGSGPARYALAADTLKDVEGEPIFSDRQNIPNAADIDCDGRLDLLIGRLTGTITRYEAEAPAGDGVPRFRHATDAFEGIEIVAAFQGLRHGANTMALGDVDRDGDHDLFWGDFFEAGLLFIENTGTCGRPALRGTPRPFPLDDPVSTSGYNAPALGDVDGDGDEDLVMGVLGGAFNPNLTSVENLHYFEQVARGDFAPRTRRLIRTLDVGSESFPAFSDLDGDGDLDMLISNKIEPGETRTGRLFAYENAGTPAAPEFVPRGPVAGLPEAYHLAPAFGDLDGDGDEDMLLGRWRDRIALYRNDGPSPDAEGIAPRWTLVDSAAATLTRGRNTTPALADLDGDGDLDLLVGESSGAINHYVNEGGPGAPDFQLASDRFQGIDAGRRSVPTTFDVDGDGDLDLIVGSESSGLLLYRNEGSATEPVFVETVPFPLRVPTFTAPAFVDLDGDGVEDLAMGGGGGGLTVYSRRPGG